MKLVCRNVLYCYTRIPSFVNAVRDYLRAFGQYSKHRIHYYDMDSGPLEFDIEPFDCIIFNYCWRCLAVSPDLCRRIANYSGLKIAIFQDEYDHFLWHEKTVIDIGINTIITCVPERYWPDVFRGEAFRQTEFINSLTGYVPESALHLPPPKPLRERNWAIGYRGRPIAYHYGRLSQEKIIIGQRMKAICAERCIPVNIELTDEARIYGAAWPEFIENCRTVLGTESGSNVFDFDGTIKPAIDTYLKTHPDSDFESVHERFLKEHEGKVRMNQVSPRIFETIAMKTGLVLFEGEYSDVVRPWEHFIPLKKDFSNIDEVLAAVSDIPKLEAMTQRAYEEVIVSGKYHFKTFTQKIDVHISARTTMGRGYEPCYGLVGWRTSENSVLQGLPYQNLCVPTDRPLRHFDQIPDPFLKVQCNWGALQRTLIQRYESVLYSRFGRWAKERLQRNMGAYSILRKIVRLLTGRW
jgi:hypothetical protein